MPKRRSLLAVFAVGFLLAAAAPAGAATDWTPADKDGFGTPTAPQSKGWHTLQNGELTEGYYPNLGTPSVRDLQFVVGTERETDATTHVTQLVDPKSLTYRQVNTAKSGAYRITKTYADDPARNTLLVRVRYESLKGQKQSLSVRYDPSLTNDGSDDAGTASGSTLLASDGKTASALAATPGFVATSNDHPGGGDLVQTAQTPLDGRKNGQEMTLALGFGKSTAEASAAASASLAGGFTAASSAYAVGWHGYLNGLAPQPASAAGHRTTPHVSGHTPPPPQGKNQSGGPHPPP